MTEAAKPERYSCQHDQAGMIAMWLRERGGLLIWQSVDLSNLGSCTTPYRNADGTPATKPHWRYANEPERHITDVAEVDVITCKEVKRFHVGLRRGSQGLSIKVSDAGSARIRNEVSKAEEKYGVPAWHVFDYGALEFDARGKNAVIMVEDSKISMTEWLTKYGPPQPELQPQESPSDNQAVQS